MRTDCEIFVRPIAASWRNPVKPAAPGTRTNHKTFGPNFRISKPVKMSIACQRLVLAPAVPTVDSMQHWLVKQEPEDYSWDDFVRDGKTDWTGVRNYQARNNLQKMKTGDR